MAIAPELSAHAITPSAAAREAFFSAAAAPFLRNRLRAASASPFDSVSARLQSIMPAPVDSRRALTWAAVIAIR